MWMLIQLLVLIFSVIGFAFAVFTDRKTNGLVRATARATAGGLIKVAALIAVYVVLIFVFTRMGWWPLSLSVVISMVSLIWGVSSPKSLEEFK